jgi:uncharacterized protein (DUF3084 family)
LALLPYLFLILIVLMSGGIAVLADDVGRRLGKKRLHFRGLRPKHVAQLGTFFTGIFVSFLTIAIVAALSSDVRQWIEAGNLAIVRAKTAESEGATARMALESEQKKVNQLRSMNDVLNGESAHARRQLYVNKRAADELAKRLADLRTRLSSLRARYDDANRRIAGLNQEVLGRQHALVAVEGRLHSTDAELKSVTEALKQAAATEKQVQAGLRVAVKEKNQTDEDNQRLMVERDHLVQQKTALEKASADATAQYAMVTHDLEKANRDLSQTKDELAKVESNLAQTTNDDALFHSISAVSRSAPPTYLQGSEVVRLPVPAGLSFQRAQDEVTTLLRMARVEAKRKGAASHGSYLEATIVPHLDPETRVMRSPNELETDVVEHIVGAKEPMVLVASSSFNAFRGEPVSIEIHAVANPIIFRRNSLVAKAEVDGREETDAIIRQLVALGDKVRARAMNEHMIPRLGSEEMYGAVSSDEVLQLVNQVKATNRAVEVRALADADTRAADPLRLHFSVR